MEGIALLEGLERPPLIRSFATTVVDGLWPATPEKLPKPGAIFAESIAPAVNASGKRKVSWADEIGGALVTKESRCVEPRTALGRGYNTLRPDAPHARAAFASPIGVADLVDAGSDTADVLRRFSKEAREMLEDELRGFLTPRIALAARTCELRGGALLNGDDVAYAVAVRRDGLAVHPAPSPDAPQE